MKTITVMKSADLLTAKLTPGGLRPGADSGNPQTAFLELAPETMNAQFGIWECQPGGWPITNRPTTEFAYILSGKANLTDEATGKTTNISTGDVVVTPAGWNGRWDVTETIKKLYAII